MAPNRNGSNSSKSTFVDLRIHKHAVTETEIRCSSRTMKNQAVMVVPAIQYCTVWGDKLLPTTQVQAPVVLPTRYGETWMGAY